ncbi:HdeD family acid-resistance protein [Arenimonas daejeonensis]|uniref:HdeD family acid-resistance protein n=1 Tax=Arenimonas daejeonensis TaxID=370777 RepID=UPI0011BE61E8|nr:DUF308 domain-containing protein [Arenimonas daejeonensis]
MSDNAVSTMGRNWWVAVAFGVISVLFAFYLFTQPLQAVVALAWAFGVLALAEGIASLLALFDPKVTVPKGWLALYGLASLAFGAVAIANPVATAGILLMLLAGWLVIAGVFRILFAIRVRKAIQGEWMIALSGVLSIGLGGLFLANLGVALVAAAVWIGVVALLYGGLQIAVGLKLRQLRPS